MNYENKMKTREELDMADKKSASPRQELRAIRLKYNPRPSVSRLEADRIHTLNILNGFRVAAQALLGTFILFTLLWLAAF